MDPERMLDVVNLLTEAYLEMIEGQYLDISYEGRRDIGMGDYLNMIARKTGALIRCSLNLGAMIGTRHTATVEAFRDFGRSLGYVFQIRDDVLGVWGDEESTGKPVGADIIRKKNSLPVVYAMSVASGSDKQLLDDAYRRDELNDEDVSMALEVMDKVHTKEYAHRIAVDHCDSAMRALSAVELEPEFRQQAEELIHFLLVRQH
jgi:geranylgeranyl diphosphate synthase type I